MVVHLPSPIKKKEREGGSKINKKVNYTPSYKRKKMRVTRY